MVTITPSTSVTASTLDAACGPSPGCCGARRARPGTWDARDVDGRRSEALGGTEPAKVVGGVGFSQPPEQRGCLCRTMSRDCRQIAAADHKPRQAASDSTHAWQRHSDPQAAYSIASCHQPVGASQGDPRNETFLTQSDDMSQHADAQCSSWVHATASQSACRWADASFQYPTGNSSSGSIACDQPAPQPAVAPLPRTYPGDGICLTEIDDTAADMQSGDRVHLEQSHSAWDTADAGFWRTASAGNSVASEVAVSQRAAVQAPVYVGHGTRPSAMDRDGTSGRFQHTCPADQAQTNSRASAAAACWHRASSISSYTHPAQDVEVPWFCADKNTSYPGCGTWCTSLARTADRCPGGGAVGSHHAHADPLCAHSSGVYQKATSQRDSGCATSEPSQKALGIGSEAHFHHSSPRVGVGRDVPHPVRARAGQGGADPLQN